MTAKLSATPLFFVTLRYQTGYDMDDSLNIQLETGLRQRLSPRQVMFGRYLEMTTPEIEEQVRHALDENPALEEVSPDSSIDAPESRDDDFTESSDDLQRADYTDDDLPPFRLGLNNRRGDDDYFEPVAVDDDQSVVDALEAQLPDFDLDQWQREIAGYIIGNIDDNGYLSRSYSSIADDITIATGREVTPAQVRAVAAIVRSMDPAGVGAVDLRDCLLLQLQRMTRSQQVNDATTIIRDYFDLFSHRHFDRLRSRAGLDDQRLSAALKVINGLNPKPGSLIDKAGSNDRLRHIVPDFNVDIDLGGHATVSLNSHLPELAIAKSFDIDAMPKPIDRRSREALAFVKARHDEASTLIGMLNARAQTLMGIMTAIADIQHRFFITGNPADIKPMILKDIATRTGYDLSVISRATAGKYVSTRSGIYPLKMLFNERRKEDSDTSAHEILAALKQLIDNEDKHHPLTDESLKDLLTDQGYEIARRTVAKYREQLGLPVARLRRKL